MDNDTEKKQTKLDFVNNRDQCEGETTQVEGEPLGASQKVQNAVSKLKMLQKMGAKFYTPNAAESQGEASQGEASQGEVSQGESAAQPKIEEKTPRTWFSRFSDLFSCCQVVQEEKNNEVVVPGR